MIALERGHEVLEYLTGFDEFCSCFCYAIAIILIMLVIKKLTSDLLKGVLLYPFGVLQLSLTAVERVYKMTLRI